MPSPELLQKADHLMTVCNACRYCEGFCAVFPAMERRRTFSASDLVFLSNLCHNCRGCYYACQYAPPHEFDINVPKTLSQLRAESYADFTWPSFLSGAFRANGAKTGWLLVLSVVIVLGLAGFFIDPDTLFSAHGDQGAFYVVVPYAFMVIPAMAVALFGVLALAIGVIRFWRHSGGTMRELFQLKAHLGALKDALSLHNLGGGGDGCNYPGEAFSTVRRRYHHLTFYGFMLCFAATIVAAFYENVLGWPAPFPYFSVPVVLGTVGGLGLCVGTVGLFALGRRSDPDPEDASLRGMDVGFLVTLFLTGLTGLVLLVLRETSAMGVLLVIHLGAVLALFLAIPYGKFVHAAYRYAALVLDHVERGRQASTSAQ